MSEGNTLINLGDLAKPATALIEKVSEGIGGLLRPYQIRRVAAAEAEAEKIHAIAQIEIDELQRRAIVRFIAEETKKQSNIEEITRKAINGLSDNAKPKDIDNDWIANFFEKCKLISDEEMQIIWGKVLAGEANTPGKYSKRTVNFLSTIDKHDAMLFETLCRFNIVIGIPTPIIFNIEDEIYKNNGITFKFLKHLDDIGLISFLGINDYAKQNLPEIIQATYYDKSVIVQFNNKSGNQLEIGKLILSKVGEELASFGSTKPIDGYFEYVLDRWGRKGIVSYSIWVDPKLL